MTFILFGLTVVASSMNLLVLRFLTMNTEDERREEIQSAVARSSLRYESGHITPNGKIYCLVCDFWSFESSSGTLLSPIYSNPVDVIAIDPNKSDCGSCRCWAFLMRRKRERKKFTVRRMPGKIAHLVPLQRFDSVVSKENLSMAKPSFSDFPRRSTPKTGMMSFDLLSRNRCSSIVRRSNSEFNPAEIATARDFARPSTLFQYDAINIRSQIDVQRNLQENSSRLHLKRSSVWLNSTSSIQQANIREREFLRLISSFFSDFNFISLWKSFSLSFYDQPSKKIDCWILGSMFSRV